LKPILIAFVIIVLCLLVLRVADSYVVERKEEQHALKLREEREQLEKSKRKFRVMHGFTHEGHRGTYFKITNPQSIGLFLWHVDHWDYMRASSNVRLTPYGTDVDFPIDEWLHVHNPDHGAAYPGLVLTRDNLQVVAWFHDDLATGARVVGHQGEESSAEIGNVFVIERSGDLRALPVEVGVMERKSFDAFIEQLVVENGLAEAD